MPNGYQQLGDIFGGGLESARESAFIDGQGARAKIDHISAQTQEALERAKLHQMDASKKQRELDADNDLADALLATGLAKTPAEAKSYATVARGGYGDFSQLATGRGSIQEQGFRSTLADDLVPESKRLAASSAIQGKVQVAGEGGNKPTTHQSDYEYGEKLRTPEEKDRFGRVVRADQIVQSGGIPVARPTAGGPAQQVVPTAVAAGNAAALAGAKAEGTGLAKRTLDLPQAKLRFASTNLKQDDIIDRSERLANDPELWKGTGAFGSLAEIPGTQGARIRAEFDTIVNKLAVQAVQEAKDLSKTGGAYGNTAVKEWEALSQSFAALNPRMHPDDLRREFGRLVTRSRAVKAMMSDAFYETYPELRQGPAPGPGANAVVKWTRDANGKPVRAQ